MFTTMVRGSTSWATNWGVRYLYTSVIGADVHCGIKWYLAKGHTVDFIFQASKLFTPMMVIRVLLLASMGITVLNNHCPTDIMQMSIDRLCLATILECYL